MPSQCPWPRLVVLIFLFVGGALLVVEPAGSGRISVAAASGPVPFLLPSVPEITADAAVVIDDATGQVLYAKNPHKRRAQASLTKITTAIVALENGYLQDLVRVSVRWSDLLDSTRMGLLRGDILTLEDLLYGLMLPSGNDAAVAIAHHIAHSEKRFVEMMNHQVADMGLQDSHYANPHGLDAEGHYSSAYDLTQLGRYALRNPAFARIVAARRVDLSGVRQIYPLRNINAVLTYYEGADGVKTGYTDNSGMGVVASATRGGRRVVVTVLRSGNYVGDAAALLDYAFANPPNPLGENSSSAGANPGDPVSRPPHLQDPPVSWDTPRLPPAIKLNGWSLWQ